VFGQVERYIVKAEQVLGNASASILDRTSRHPNQISMPAAVSRTEMFYMGIYHASIDNWRLSNRMRAASLADKYYQDIIQVQISLTALRLVSH
jgi:hypothetical protein